jgi:hypothetical protein
MCSPHTIATAVALLLGFILAACAGSPTPAPPTKAPEPTQAPPPTAEPTPTATVAANDPQPEFANFDADNFGHSTKIDNEWFPMQPGTYWAYEGSFVDEDGDRLERRLEFTVTDLTKEIAGVRTVVAWIVDYNDGEIVEKEIAFYAQDNDGNIWYFGEHPEEYEDGNFIDAPTWIAGQQDARPGVKMKAKPQLGTSSYFQGWGPAVEWSDYAQIDQMGQKTCVPVDCYEDVLIIAESSLGEKGAFQLKHYARGVGEVRVGWRGTDTSQEDLQLVEHARLDADALAKIREEALALEKHAYEVSKDVYGPTSPAE